MVQPIGASVKTPPSCDKGTYLPTNTTYEGPEDCVGCPPGTSCAGGASPSNNCSAGTAAPTSNMDKCDKCAAGTYQDREGQTACVACTPGSFCKEGAAAALPCPGGRYGGATDLTAADDCTKAKAGYYAPIGSTVQKQCNPGTFDRIDSEADRPLDRINGTDICELCPRGTYQPAKGAISCLPCADEELGVYCPSEGTSTPIPCPGGTFSEETGLYSELQCTSVEAGFYAPSEPNRGSNRGPAKHPTCHSPGRGPCRCSRLKGSGAVPGERLHVSRQGG